MQFWSGFIGVIVLDKSGLFLWLCLLRWPRRLLAPLLLLLLRLLLRLLLLRVGQLRQA